MFWGRYLIESAKNSPQIQCSNFSEILYDVSKQLSTKYNNSLSSEETHYPVETERDRGISVSSDMSWFLHVHNIASRAQAVASWVLSAFQSRDKVTMITMYIV